MYLSHQVKQDDKTEKTHRHLVQISEAQNGIKRILAKEHLDFPSSQCSGDPRNDIFVLADSTPRLRKGLNQVEQSSPDRSGPVQICSKRNNKLTPTLCRWESLCDEK